MKCRFVGIGLNHECIQTVNPSEIFKSCMIIVYGGIQICCGVMIDPSVKDTIGSKEGTTNGPSTDISTVKKENRARKLPNDWRIMFSVPPQQLSNKLVCHALHKFIDNIIDSGNSSDSLTEERRSFVQDLGVYEKDISLDMTQKEKNKLVH
ncbi:hypothetical protein L1987_19245 [Smallanthus sonchifolius]|uniref:Uncharacterized protein n=1 Tax=Smallanthus sonchifolius TaxID=185202 RepID=A0ACB9IN33_9ASTR|nr:hypothetical protein L1987_19245 [Smallanthus sonchifolius]